MGSGPAWTPRPSAGREERAAWRGPRGAGEGCGRKPVSDPPPSGAPRGDPRPGGRPKVGDAVGAPRSPRIPEGPGRERGPGSRAVPCAPSKWRPPLRVEATGDRLRPAQGPSPFPPPLPCSLSSARRGAEAGAAPHVPCCVCVCREGVRQPPPGGEGCLQNHRRRPQGQQFSLHQWKVRHPKEHRREYTSKTLS